MAWDWYRHAADNLINGNISDAIEILTRGCKTKPYKLAYRTVHLVGYLCDDLKRPDEAAKLMRALKARS